ncbi:MAG TPA: sigma-70 family RNA polymerase sigma factor [Armatimonadota bacterium]|nr:sigma-70 family RNA polymerase sigma factor [Armatimonadota bacterium]HQK95218.1 sigma-70 family RNA polymerase sigma factor [Armatimonadota bacterium]
MTELADRALVARARRGDTEAFGALVDRHRQRVFGVAYRMLGDVEAANDVAQEAFVRAFERLESFRSSGSFVAWLVSIASNLCIDIQRRSRRTPMSLDVMQEEKGYDPADPRQAAIEHRLGTDEAADAIHQALEKLPAAQRLAITLRHIEGLGYEEIGQAMGVPVGTAKTHVHRGRERLARMLHRFYAEVGS